jgi:hypothetical protein
MTPKSIPLSVRVPEEDADFIAGLEIEGAVTPSDKLRAIIGQARKRVEGLTDYPSGLVVMEETLAPALRLLRTVEHDQKVRSELVRVIGEWLPEAMAFLLSEASRLAAEEDSRALLVSLEHGLAERVFSLFETVLRMGVTRQCPCYDGDAVAQRLGPILELTGLIASRLDKEQEVMK